MTEHILGILASMLRSLPADSAERIRLLAKFVEKNYEKIERVIQLRRDYASKVSVVDAEMEVERGELSAPDREDRADEWFSRRLDAGLFSLQVGLNPLLHPQLQPNSKAPTNSTLDNRHNPCLADCRRHRSKIEDKDPTGRSR